MPRFTDPQKRDPFRNFNFRIFLGGVEVAACSKMSGLSASVEVAKFRAGNSASSVDEMLPGRATYEPVTLEGGVTNDSAFEDWATALVRNEWDQGLRAVEPDFRRDVEILVYDLDLATPVKRYILHRAWVSKYAPLSELVGSANDVLIETIEIQHEGYTREAIDADA